MIIAIEVRFLGIFGGVDFRGSFWEVRLRYEGCRIGSVRIGFLCF